MKSNDKTISSNDSLSYNAITQGVIWKTLILYGLPTPR